LTEKLSFAVENVELIEESNNSQFATLKIDAFASGNNRHSLYVSEDTLKKTAQTILEKPIIWEYSRAKDDATTHSDNQIICGFIPKDSPIEFRKLEDSRVMMSVIGKLWVRYAGKMTDIFKRDKSKSVSVEMEVLEENETSNFGIPELLSYCYQGITVLGESVLPAIRNAKADLVAFASKEQEEYLRAYELEFSNKYADIDFTIPKKVKLSAQKSLDTYKEKGNNATSISLAMGRFLAKNEKATPEKIRMMCKFFNRKILPDDITLGFFGGKEGAKWCKEIMSAVDEIDNRQLSYFGEDDVITFPYKSIGDINPALKGINPPISLAQANEIARVADAIGVSEEKNGWAIAISQFKKNHKVENGHWVKKESMSEEVDMTEEFAKEDLGKGSALTADKSKEKVSDTAWGDVDKTALMHKVLGASNYKSLVHDVYLLVEDGWEDHPSSSLKYPVMQLVGDTFVYNKSGLSAALGRAKGQGESAVANKVESIQTKLGLNKTEKEEMSVEDEKDLKEKEEKTEEMAVKEPEKETPDEEKKEQKEEGENKEETSEEEAKEEEKETKEEKMSLDENLDISALLAFLEGATEANEEMVAKYKTGTGDFDHGMIHKASLDKMCKMAEDLKKAQEDKDVYMAEFDELKKFKADIEAKQFAFEVESTLKDVVDTMPKDKVDEAREDSKNFSLDNVDAWKNKVRADAFSYSKDRKPNDGIMRMALPWNQGNKDKPDLTHGWVKK
jgi:hypothetical protein